MLRRDGFVVAAREVHVLYESEGLPGESFVGAMRYVRREGKAAVLEQRLVEAATGASGRAGVGRAAARAGRHRRRLARPYFARVAEIEGREIPTRPAPARRGVGPARLTSSGAEAR